MSKARIKDRQETLITREQYNALRKMDRAEAETFLQSIYKRGYDKGYKDADEVGKDLINNASQDSERGIIKDFKAEMLSFFDFIRNTRGIGPATLRKIKEALEKWSV